jgi:hypothetical protein
VAVVGDLLSLRVRAAVAVVLYLALAGGATLRRYPWPQLDRETEQSLLHRGPIVWALANGGQLGLGFTSRIGFWSWYLVPVGAFLIADPAFGAIAWGTYGLVRLLVAVSTAYRSADPDQLLRRSVALLHRRGRATIVTRYLTVGLAAVLALAAGF